MFRFLNKDRAAPPARAPHGERIYAVGDIHGCDALLRELLGAIGADMRADLPARATIVFIGDYVDRGLGSRTVVDLLLSIQANPAPFAEAVFLKGNHDDALLRFLEEPAFGRDWTAYGGAETLAAYGVSPPDARAPDEAWTAARDAFAAALPPSHLAFFQSLTLSRRIGDLFFAHAGARPGRTLDQQEAQDLMWIRHEFLGDRRRFPAVVVHGHTPEAEPYADDRRICVDTGAYATGVLTAARVAPDGVTFLSARGRPA